MKNLSKKEKVLIILIVSVPVLYLLYSKIVHPIYQDFIVTNENILKYEMQLRRIDSIVASDSDITEQYESAEESYSIFSLKLPKEINDVEIINDLVTISNTTVVNLLEIDFSGEDATTPTTESEVESLIPVSVSIGVESRSYTNLLRFVDAIEKDDRVLEVVNVSMTKKTDISETGYEYDAIVEVIYYYTTIFE